VYSCLFRYGPASKLDDNLELLAKHLIRHFKSSDSKTKVVLESRHVEEGHDLSHMIRTQYKEYLAMASCFELSKPTQMFPTEPGAQDFTEDIALQTLHDTIAIIPEIVTRLEQMARDAFGMLTMLQEMSTKGDFMIARNYSVYCLRAKNWHEQLSELDQSLERSTQPPTPLDSYDPAEPGSISSSDASSEGTTWSDVLSSRGY